MDFDGVPIESVLRLLSILCILFWVAIAFFGALSCVFSLFSSSFWGSLMRFRCHFRAQVAAAESLVAALLLYYLGSHQLLQKDYSSVVLPREVA